MSTPLQQLHGDGKNPGHLLDPSTDATEAQHYTPHPTPPPTTLGTQSYSGVLGRSRTGQ